MNELTNQDVLDFIRQLVDLGNCLHLEDSNMTIINQKGEEICVPEAGEVKPIQILFNGIIKDESKASLNPFKVVEGDNPAQRWFYDSRVAVIGTLIKKLIVKLVEIGTTKETEEYENISVLEGVSEICDKTMIDELGKINVSDYFRIFYNKKNKTAEPQTLVFTDAIEEQYKSIRKKTWHALVALFKKIFKLEDEETTLAKYGYKATILSIPEIDSKLHVMGKIMTVIGPLCRSFLKTDVYEDKFNKHLENLEAYARMYAWFTSKVTAPGATTQVLSNAQPAGPAWTVPQTAASQPAPQPVQSNPNTIPISPRPTVSDLLPVAGAGPMMPQAGPQPYYGIQTTYTNAISPSIGVFGQPAVQPGYMPPANGGMPSINSLMPVANQPYVMPQQMPYYNGYQQPMMQPMPQQGYMPPAQPVMQPAIGDDGRIPIR